LDIHEYQAKEILAEYGVKIADGGLAYSPEEAIQRAREINSNNWVVKAQIHSGARGKAGGIKICETHDEVEMAAEELLGKRLVTQQSGPAGKICSRVYVEAGVGLIVTPSSSNKAIFSAALSPADEIIAPACPMRFPSGAVKPAM